MRLVIITHGWKWMVAALSLGALPTTTAVLSYALPHIPLCVPEECGPDDDTKAWFIAIAKVFVIPCILLIISECILILFYVQHLNKRLIAHGAKKLTPIEILMAILVLMALTFIGFVLSIMLLMYISNAINQSHNMPLPIG